MPFVCSLCGIEIAVGEPMVPNIRMEVAHDRCIQKEISTRLPEVPSDVVILKIETKVDGPGFGNPTASLEPCLPPTLTSVCSECEDNCIAICPYCGKRVCPTYGWNGKTCSVAHEGRCAGARESREPLKKVRPPAAMKPNGPIFDTEPIGNGRNGRHKAKPKGRSRR